MPRRLAMVGGLCWLTLALTGCGRPAVKPPLLVIPAGPLPEYTIRRAAGPIVIDGKMGEPSWPAAETVGEFMFPWWQAGEKERTEARILWDEQNLYVCFVAHDKHISAFFKERDEGVSRDDCVEVFIAPDPSDVSKYFNFEFNALGTILDRSPREKRSADWNAPGIKVAITHDGTLNDDADEDRMWTVEIAIPFDSFAEYCPRLPPADGDVWRLNVYRCGGEVNPQHSAWSNTAAPRPRFHVPERFGVVHFSTQPVLRAPSPSGKGPG